MQNMLQNFPPVQQNDDFFQYDIEFEGLAPGDAVSNNIQIQQDSHFLWVKSTYQCDVAAAQYTYLTAPVPLVSVMVVDQTSQRQLYFQPMPVSSAFGRGVLPFILPRPRPFRPLTAIGVTVANFSADQTYNLRLIFSGIKLFNYGGEPLN